jgi:predicted MFS family arabinose efflux permease
MTVATTAEADRILTRPFLILCTGGFTLLVSFMLLLAVLPLYVKDERGAGDGVVGLVIGVFALAALAPRPFVGREIDRSGGRRFLMAGAAIFATSSLLYIVALSIPALLAVRVLHGVGMACFHTAAFTMVADLAPASRRAEAMGIWGMMSTFAIAIAPYLGLLIHDGPGNRAVFLTSAGLALCALGLLSLVPNPPKSAAVAGTSAPVRGGLIEPRVFVPAVLVLTFTLVYGAVQSFVLIYAEEREIPNAGFYFTAFAGATLVARFAGGRLADRRGRWAVILPSLALTVVAMVVLSVAGSLPALLLVGALFGLAFGSGNPAMTALAIDLTPPERRGAAMATFTSAFELGIGVGSIAAGWVAALTSYSTMFLACGLSPAFGLAFGAGKARQRPHPLTPSPVPTGEGEEVRTQRVSSVAGDGE